jgi:hypothetical protein
MIEFNLGGNRQRLNSIIVTKILGQKAILVLVTSLMSKILEAQFLERLKQNLERSDATHSFRLQLLGFQMELGNN